MRREYVVPYLKINFPIQYHFRLKFPIPAPSYYLKNIYSKFPHFFTNKSIKTNPRIVENSLLFYLLAKYKCMPPSKILEVGCCENYTSIQLQAIGFDVTAVDINEYELKELGGPNFTYIQKDIADCDFDEECFDAAISISTIEHIGMESYGESEEEDKDLKVVGLIYKWLKKGGLFIFSVPMKNKFEVINKFERHYDFKTIKKFFNKFKVCEETYIAQDEKGCWRITQKEKVKDQNNLFVGMFVLRK